MILTGILLLLSVFIIAPLDRDPYKNTAHYQKMKHALDSIPSYEAPRGPLKAGWAKINITPDFPLSIASYGLRSSFEEVHDSIYCRAFVFDNGKTKSAMVIMDLLIFPPSVVDKLKVELPKIGFALENTFLSATHTHNGPGGWAEGIGGRFLSGKFSEEYVDELTKASIEAIKRATASMETAALGFGKYEAKKYIFNRLSREDEDLDHWLRVIKIQKKSGATAALVTYAAHPNVLKSTVNHISGDYAGALIDSLEGMKGIDFAAFSAGAVGSHSCNTFRKENYDFIKMISSNLYRKVRNNFDSIKLEDTVKIKSIFVPVYLREPQLKISEDWKIRPWFFNFIFQKQNIFVSAMQVGNIVLIGTPCDFSGELVKEFSEDASQKNIHLVVTSFNGGYIGYIIPDKYYDIPRREARDMNWYGPYSGEYFTEIIKTILQKI